MEGNTILSLCFPSAQAGGAVDDAMTRTFQLLCEDIAQQNHCQASLDVHASNDNTFGTHSHQSLAGERLSSFDTRYPSVVVYNVTLSGAYSDVMHARGALMRNSPLKPRLSIPVSKALITSPVPPVDQTKHPQERDKGKDQEQSSRKEHNGPSTTTTTILTAGPDTTPVQSSSQASSDPASSSAEGSNNGPSDPNTRNTQSLPPFTSHSNDSHASLDARTLTQGSATAPTTFAPTFTVLPLFKTAVDKISASTRTSIALLSSPIHPPTAPEKAVAAFSRQEMVELVVTGTWENAEAARALLLVAIDTLEPGIISDSLTVELNGSPVDPRYNDIHITGEAKQVAKAKAVLHNACLRAQTESMSCTRTVNIAARKLDWMLLNHREKLRAIMTDNASFIAFPPLGGTYPTIFVYGQSSVNVERTIRTVMQLSCHFHSGSILMRDIPHSMHTLQSPAALAGICKVVSQSSEAEIEYRANGFQMCGSEVQARKAMMCLTRAEIVKALPSEFKFSVELANEHREFISGKKNGKINRIMKTTGAKIKFDQCNEYNFYVDLSSSIAAKAMEALELLQEELPAEISFFVPETYHKRIIGVGGKNIQRIMKKFGVYVKFSNAEEFAKLGGYYDNLDNVVARTPSKNAVNLDFLKQAVMELVSPKDKDFIYQHLDIPKHQHLNLLSDHAITLREIHDATNATIFFPARELGRDTVSIYGPDSLMQQAVAMLLSVVEEQYVYPVPYSESMANALSLSEFQKDVVDVIKQDWNITLMSPPINTKLTGLDTATTQDANGTDDNGAVKSEERESEDKVVEIHPDHVFVFEYTRNNEERLPKAKERLTRYLISHQVLVDEDELLIPGLRPDSFAESLAQFPNRRPTSLGLGDILPQTPLDYSLFDGGRDTFDSLGNSMGGMSLGSSDIRSIFTPNTGSVLSSLSTSPSRWPEHARHMSAFQNSPTALGTTTTSITGTPSFGLGPVPGLGQTTGSPSAFPRVASLPQDPWATAKHQQQQRQSQSSGGYLGSIGDLRSSPQGISTTSLSGLPQGSGYYSPGGYTQPPHTTMHTPEAAYNKAPGFQMSGNMTPVHRYSGSNSPVHGPTGTPGNYGNMMGLPTSNQAGSTSRPSSGSAASRGSMQLLEDKMLAGSAFGAGYGPALNSGSGARTGYQQQQSQLQQSPLHSQPPNSQASFAGQPFPTHLPVHHGGSYPQQRQRHSSQNSAASHHTMGLGHIGGGPGSAGGSVNSDEISTEDDSDEVFDEMRNRHRMHSTPTSLFQQHKQLQQGYHSSGLSGGYEGYSSHNSSSSSLLNRRGSAGSTHSTHLQQAFFSQKNGDYAAGLGNGAIDIFGQGSLVNSLEKQEGDLSVGGSRLSQGRIGQNRAVGGNAGNSSSGLPGLSSELRFEEDRGFFSSGFGGIIGDGAHGYGQLSGSVQGQSFLPSSTNGAFGAHNTNATVGGPSFGSFGETGDGLGNGQDARSNLPSTPGLSATAAPFYMDTSSQHFGGQGANRASDGNRAVGWDR
ncbi:hypothetical protein BG015_000822 [Linnemannia schmuckeri]|uniref:K Homology domain-containing protein n=1 Tax=Linnemannia schmuckeri TaxID=64567 RepID=A0A9P5RR11_9FUNG|nr:hypothetical protein BG015_000822 [Linnemannia schmuckeri]